MRKQPFIIKRRRITKPATETNQMSVFLTRKNVNDLVNRKLMVVGKYHAIK